MGESHDRHQVDMMSEIREKRPTNKQLCERLDNIESFDEIYNRCCLSWFKKLENMPGAIYENPSPHNLLGAWCENIVLPLVLLWNNLHLCVDFSDCYLVGPMIWTPKSSLRYTEGKYLYRNYLDLLHNLKFDESDPILGSNHGEPSCIFALITGNNVEFNLRADHGLHELVKNWQLDSTASVN